MWLVAIEEYLVGLVAETNDWYTVIYERLFYAGGGRSEKYLCTFTKTGSFLSRLQIASFVYAGTGIGFSVARVPWFTATSGTVFSTDRIEVNSDEDMRLYRISCEGIIHPVR